MRDTREFSATQRIDRSRLNQRFTPHAPILVEQRAALAAERIVPDRERAVEIADVEFAEVLKHGDRIVHRRG